MSPRRCGRTHRAGGSGRLASRRTPANTGAQVNGVCPGISPFHSMPPENQAFSAARLAGWNTGLRNTRSRPVAQVLAARAAGRPATAPPRRAAGRSRCTSSRVSPVRCGRGRNRQTPGRAGSNPRPTGSRGALSSSAQPEIGRRVDVGHRLLPAKARQVARRPEPRHRHARVRLGDGGGVVLGHLLGSVTCARRIVCPQLCLPPRHTASRHWPIWSSGESRARGANTSRSGPTGQHSEARRTCAYW